MFRSLFLAAAPDAVMNMKGYAGHYGLERYEMIEALNMGSQVLNKDFIAKAIEIGADVLLVSQTVTQKDVHIKNLIELIEMLEVFHFFLFVKDDL